MKIVLWNVNLFAAEPVPMEGTACRLLQAVPLRANVTFLAAPWSVLINRGTSATPTVVSAIDRRRNQLIRNPGPPRLHGEAFTICQHVKYASIIPRLLKCGVSTLFSPHAEDQHHTGMAVLPCPHLAPNAVEPAAVKDLLYSFVGYHDHAIRCEILRLPRAPDIVLIGRKRWHFQDADPKFANEYRSTLARSRFSLCPRGIGPGTLRFWESLAAGAIPVLIGDSTRLPDGIDWSTCILRVPEARTAEIDRIIRSVPPVRERAMRLAAINAYRQASGDNLVRCIRSHYGEGGVRNGRVRRVGYGATHDL